MICRAYELLDRNTGNCLKQAVKICSNLRADDFELHFMDTLILCRKGLYITYYLKYIVFYNK